MPQQADLELIQSVNMTTANRDEELIFTSTITNRGPDSATGVSVRDLLPAGLNLIRTAQTVGTYNQVTGVWNIGGLPVDATQTLQLVATIDSTVPVTNVAEVLTSDQFDPDSTPDNQATAEDDLDAVIVTPRVIDVSVAARLDPLQPDLGDVVEMVFTIRNDGPDDATGLEAQFSVPAGLALISALPERGTIAGDGVWNVGSLAAGERVDLVITARAETRGTKRVPFQVIAHDQNDSDSAPANNIPTEDDQIELLVQIPLFSKRLFLGSR